MENELLFDDFYNPEWEREHLEFQARFSWLPEWPQDDVLEF